MLATFNKVRPQLPARANNGSAYELMAKSENLIVLARNDDTAKAPTGLGKFPLHTLASALTFRRSRALGACG